AVKVTSVCREGLQLDDLAGGEMNVYPNPADDHLVIELSLDASIVNTEAIIELVDLLGRTLQQAKVPVSEGHLQYDLVLADKVMTGTYFIKASVNNKLFLKTIVVQR
ncbi:MAG TPA: T9SS type A sorting domain-containing protein, partial [Chitinophagales bacterium]|nr:T9SS type A sorting domain-containing protein [Chitinophagales bacterium]